MTTMVEVYEVGLSQLDGWLRKTVFGNTYSAGVYLVMQTSVMFDNSCGNCCRIVGAYLEEGNALDAAKKLAEVNECMLAYFGGTVCDHYEVWHVVDDADDTPTPELVTESGVCIVCTATGDNVYCGPLWGATDALVNYYCDNRTPREIYDACVSLGDRLALNGYTGELESYLACECESVLV